MSRKLLPLPVGEKAPTGSSVRFWQQHGFRTRLDAATVTLAVLLGVTGAWLGLNPADVVIGLDHSGYHLGTTTLTPVESSSFAGEVALVLREQDGQVRGAAAGRLGGEPMQGLCVYVIGTTSEECIFVVGRHSFHARDTLHDGSWERRYDDGRTLRLKLADPKRPVPVPVPIGHS